MDIQGILGIDSDVRNGFNGIKVTLQDRRRRDRRTRSRRSSPSRRSARRSTTSSPTRPTSPSRSTDDAATRRGAAPCRNTTTVIIGAGHAGLAMSRCLTERSIDHVVLERGEVANSWRTERWDSLRLLTPNWQSRLPGFGYEGDDPDGFMTMPEVVDFIDALRAGDRRAGARRSTTVTSVRRSRRRLSRRDRPGRLAAPHGGPGQRRLQPRQRARPSPRRCRPGSRRSRRSTTATPTSSPRAACSSSAPRPPASSSPTRSTAPGRPVTLAVGEHVRVPRLYRGRTSMWWMDAAGVLDERYDEVDDLVRARNVPSLQLVGSPERGDARPQRAHSASACSSSAGLPGSATARRSSPARCATCARSPT